MTKEKKRPDEINVEAYRSDEEPWRLIRLQRVIGFIAAFSEYALSDIGTLRDEKGQLTVMWLNEPTQFHKLITVTAWESIVGDHSSSVIHEW